MAEFNYKDLGNREYKKVWDLQERLIEEVIADKRERKKPSKKNYFLMVEHPHVYTLGRSGDKNNLLADKDFLDKIGASFFRIDRGGDITYHGPGQVVGYPIIDLEYFNIGVHDYIEKMEEAIIQTIAAFGIKGGRRKGATGVWIEPEHPTNARKICAIGVRMSRFVTMHGFALNVNTDMRYYDYINPCGFKTLGVASMQKELNENVDLEIVKSFLKKNFNEIY